MSSQLSSLDCTSQVRRPWRLSIDWRRVLTQFSVVGVAPDKVARLITWPSLFTGLGNWAFLPLSLVSSLSAELGDHTLTSKFNQFRLSVAALYSSLQPLCLSHLLHGLPSREAASSRILPLASFRVSAPERPSESFLDFCNVTRFLRLVIDPLRPTVLQESPSSRHHRSHLRAPAQRRFWYLLDPAEHWHGSLQHRFNLRGYQPGLDLVSSVGRSEPPRCRG